MSASAIPRPIPREHARYIVVQSQAERRIAADRAMDRREAWKTAALLAFLVAVFVVADLTGPNPWLVAIWRGVVATVRAVVS